MTMKNQKLTTMNKAISRRNLRYLFDFVTTIAYEIVSVMCSTEQRWIMEEEIP